MPNLSATITYNPTTNSWSIDQAPIHVPAGGTSNISWGIQLSSGQTGAIKFDCSNAAQPAIDFDAGWPGSTPTGNDSSWSASINNTLARGSQPVEYKYGVRALYQAQGNSNWQPKHWDPDVEEDPPSAMLHS